MYGAGDIGNEKLRKKRRKKSRAVEAQDNFNLLAVEAGDSMLQRR